VSESQNNNYGSFPAVRLYSSLQIIGGSLCDQGCDVASEQGGNVSQIVTCPVPGLEHFACRLDVFPNGIREFKMFVKSDAWAMSMRCPSQPVGGGRGRAPMQGLGVPKQNVIKKSESWQDISFLQDSWQGESDPPIVAEEVSTENVVCHCVPCFFGIAEALCYKIGGLSSFQIETWRCCIQLKQLGSFESLRI
jgi:hypothetical protein